MKVLLVQPPSRSAIKDVLETTSPPLGLAYLAAVLEEEGVDVRVLDCVALNISYEDACREINYWSPDIVGVTATTPAHYEAVKILRAAKSAGAFTVAGGPHFTFIDLKVMEEHSFVDCVVRGEGEETFKELIKAVERGGELKEIPGVTYRERGVVKRAPDRPLIENLDKLPIPAYHLLPMEKYTFGRQRYGTVMTSRGCPFRCSFCASSRLFGKRWRGRSAESVADELELLADKYKVRNVEFLDDTFTLNSKRAEEICNEIRRRGLDLSWGCSSRVDTISRGLLRKLKDAGCRIIYYGAESGSQRILNAMRKGVRLAQVIRTFKETAKAGIERLASFILGFPGETLDTIKMTVRFARLLNPDYVQFTICTPYPGTELRSQLEERGGSNI
ncbi:MAG: radical SAM protein [Candidatus Freyarchaeota archaeon]|nr:radical SAM protein [Candidatus Jordarchaeia archaeon]